MADRNTQTHSNREHPQKGSFTPRQEHELGNGTEGVFLVDKPTGITSHDIIDRVRKITGIRRVGHAGTLDPLASGLLIVLVGRKFTKLQAQFMKLPKTYTCTAQLGLTTDTYDSEGKILEEADWSALKIVEKSTLENAVSSFRGEIEQTVPAYSAIKQQGKKLYELARKGKLDQTQLPSRKVQIFSLDLHSFKKDPATSTIEFSFETTVSSGTYIRSLVFDIGKKLGVGATVTALRRTQIGNYSL